MKSKKSILIVVYSLIALLVTSVIVLACVPRGNMPFDVKAETVSVYDSSNGSTTWSKGDASYDKFTPVLSGAFSQSMLTAIFSGRLNGGDYNLSLVNKPSLTSARVKMEYNEVQTLYFGNSKARFSTDTDKDVLFDTVQFEISSTTSFKGVYFYLINSTTTDAKCARITVYGNTASIYNYLEDYNA